MTPNNLTQEYNMVPFNPNCVNSCPAVLGRPDITPMALPDRIDHAIDADSEGLAIQKHRRMVRDARNTLALTSNGRKRKRKTMPGKRGGDARKGLVLVNPTPPAKAA